MTSTRFNERPKWTEKIYSGAILRCHTIFVLRPLLLKTIKISRILREDEVSHGKVLTPQDVPVQAKLAYPYNNFIATKTKKKYSASYPRNLIDFELL